MADSPIKKLTKSMSDIKALHGLADDTHGLVQQLAAEYQPVVDHIKGEAQEALNDLRALKATIGLPNAMKEDEKVKEENKPIPLSSAAVGSKTA